MAPPKPVVDGGLLGRFVDCDEARLGREAAITESTGCGRAADNACACGQNAFVKCYKVTETLISPLKKIKVP